MISLWSPTRRPVKAKLSTSSVRSLSMVVSGRTSFGYFLPFLCNSWAMFVFSTTNAAHFIDQQVQWCVCLSTFDRIVLGLLRFSPFFVSNIKLMVLTSTLIRSKPPSTHTPYSHDITTISDGRQKLGCTVVESIGGDAGFMHGGRCASDRNIGRPCCSP